MNESSQGSNTSVLVCKNLHRSFQLGPETLAILKGIDFNVSAGERIAIMGASGAGKSTLLNLLGALDEPDEGEVWIAGEKTNGLSETERAKLRNKSLGFVFQFHHLLPEFSAIENVAMTLWLSERQRVAIARALAGKPDVLLMDEPTGNLDRANALRILELIEQLNDSTGSALILVTHDAEIAKHMDRQLELSQGLLTESAT